MLLSDEACVEVIVFRSATQLSERSLKLFPLCDHYCVLLQYSQLQFSKAELLPVKRHYSLTFPQFWGFFLLTKFQTTILSVSTKQEIVCYVKKIS